MPDWLFIRPLFDEATEYTFDEAQDAIEYLKTKGIEVIDLPKEQAIRENVEKILRENPNIYVAHYNHGSDDKLWGNDERPVIDLNNVDLLSNRECYNNNCSSAKKLGVEAWKRGAVYWGYKDIFYFTTDAIEEFKEFVNNGIKRRVDGHSWKECLSMTKELATKLIDNLVKAGKALAAACMMNDRDCLVCYNAETPTTDCTARKIAIKVFGPKLGWRLTRTFPISIALFFLGLGILLHDYFHTLWKVGGYKEILSFQGGYFGVTILIIGFLLAYYQVWTLWTTRKS